MTHVKLKVTKKLLRMLIREDKDALYELVADAIIRL